MVFVSYRSPFHGKLDFVIGENVETFEDVFYIFSSGISMSGESTNQFTLQTKDGHYIGDLIEYGYDIGEYVEERDYIELIRQENLYPPTSVRNSGNLYESEILNVSDMLKCIRDGIENNNIILDNVVSPLPNEMNISSTPYNNSVTLMAALSMPSGNNIVTLTGEERVTVLSSDGFDKIKCRLYGKDSNEVDLCIFCQCFFDRDDELKILNCKHEFHEDCLRGWLMKEKNECPICRDEVKEGAIVNMVSVSHDIDLNELEMSL